jgi:hypothetical protein
MSKILYETVPETERRKFWELAFCAILMRGPHVPFALAQDLADLATKGWEDRFNASNSSPYQAS